MLILLFPFRRQKQHKKQEQTQGPSAKIGPQDDTVFKVHSIISTKELSVCPSLGHNNVGTALVLAVKSKNNFLTTKPGGTRCFLAMVLTSRCDTSLWVRTARAFSPGAIAKLLGGFYFRFLRYHFGKRSRRQNVNQWQSRQRTLLKTAKSGVPSDSVLSLGWKRVRHAQRGDKTENQHR